MSKFFKALILVVIFLIGVALIILPFVYDMFDRTRAADEMMEAFRPIVNTEHHQALTADLATLKAMSEDTKTLIDKLAGQLQMTEDQMTDFLTSEAPKLAAGMGQMQEMLGRLGRDTKTIGEQVDNFAAAEKLPVRATPYLMIALGAVIVILLLLRLAMWKPAKKEKPAEPPKPVTPNS